MPPFPDKPMVPVMFSSSRSTRNSRPRQGRKGPGNGRKWRTSRDSSPAPGPTWTSFARIRCVRRPGGQITSSGVGGPAKLLLNRVVLVHPCGLTSGAECGGRMRPNTSPRQNPRVKVIDMLYPPIPISRKLFGVFNLPPPPPRPPPSSTSLILFPLTGRGRYDTPLAYNTEYLRLP